VTFSFQLTGARSCNAREWLDHWERKYPSEKYDEKKYDYLIGRVGVLSSEDLILLGRWKDAAWSEKKWRPNVAMVAFPAWMDVSKELLGFRIDQTSPEEFLNKWSERSYPDTSSRSPDGKKHFGLPRATTLLHFISAGKFPIYDSRVRTAVRRLCNARALDDVESYLNFYIPIFGQLVNVCGASLRSVDKALHAYGGRSVRAA
jgi:hypothetical protein